ncbi:dTDP-glucose 4,6-dehydratase [Acidisarcina polymorpha]|uniref:UDP-glucuronate decarboxylase n=1 Tax=Acidisarcina polymorpha TaxID=2211140 RepID=A0A2Z5G7I2_9BACT|nr:dTDP-glucose 4,6-dehydratase [Acidisarcina polymorpha]
MGSHLTQALLADDHIVTGIDNFSTGKRENLTDFIDDPHFKFVEHDITHPFDLGRVDYIFNFASPASPGEYMRLGIETLMVGSHGTLNVLELARKYDAGFLQASTSECYGDPLVHPQREDYWGNVNPVGPRSVYDESKRYAEALTMAYYRYHGVNTHLVRIFNTYGPRLSVGDGRVVSNFIAQALRGEDLTVYGDGQQTRSFCYVSDLIDGILRLSRSSEHLPVNIGNPHEMTVLECAMEVLAATNSRSKIRHEALPQDDPTRRRPDISKANALLDWHPSIDLRQGLQLSLEYFRNLIEQETAAKTG